METAETNNRAGISIDANLRVKEKNYWLDKLSGEWVKSFFPYDKKKTGAIKYQPQSITFQCPNDVFAGLMRLSNNSDIRLHIILTAILLGLLDKYTSNEDIITGATIKKQEMEGEFINKVLILRNRLHKNLTFKELVLQLSQTMAEANQYVNYPMEALLYQLNIPYSSPEEEFPLFDVALLLTNIHEKKDLEHINLNMIFSFSRNNQSIEGEVEYNSLLYHQSSIERIISHYKTYLKAALEDVNIRLAEIGILGEAEKKKLLWNFNCTAESNYPRDKTIHQLFEKQAVKIPGNIAAAEMAETSDGPAGRRLTYRQLNEKANQLAQLLRNKGIKSDDIIALLMGRSAEMIIGILGVLKAGGGYLPIDPDYPEERTKFMLEDSQAKILLTAKIPSEKMIVDREIIDLENEGIFQNDNHHKNTHDITAPANVCYIIYTSGTTGNPKGVLVEHRNVVRLMFNDDFLFEFDRTDVWTMFHSYCFDFSVWEMYGALLYGGKLLVIPKMVPRDPGRYLEILREEQVTVLNQTPSGFSNLVNEELQSHEKKLALKYIIFGGEALNPVILKEWKARYPETKFINMYGITETTVHVTYKEITTAEMQMDSSSIGKPIPTLGTYIMGPDRGLLPMGAPGEIWVGGEGVARGYLNRPELTGEKFVQNLYKPGEKLYRTGDQARLLENGEMEYAGRMDNQVKIRAHRIELGEVEHQLMKFPPIKDVVVLACEDSNGEQQLAAYVVPQPESCFTIHRLLKMEKQGILKNHQYYDLPNGMTTFYLNRAETDFMYREIFEKSSYTKYGITLEDGACVFDVGANVGIFSLFVHRGCKNAKIFAFEPIPPIFELLNLNASVYDAKGNIKTFQCGLSSSESEADFTYYPNATVLSSRFADEAQEMKNMEAFMRNQADLQQAQVEGGGIWEEQLGEFLEDRLNTEHFTCQLKTLSRVIRENNVEIIDLLKIDVEKSEIDVLKGINEADWTRIRQIVIEVHDIDSRLESIVHILKRHGYEVTTEQDSELQETDLYNIYARRPNDAPGNTEENEDQFPCTNDLEPGPGNHRSWNSTGSLVKDIRDHLKEKLPGYMIPGVIMLMEHLPVTPNGKVDRLALPEPGAQTPGQYVAPGNKIEKKVAGIWKEALKLERVGINESFFDIGGTSINIIQVNTRIRDVFNQNIPMVKLFEYPTIKEFARYLEQMENTREDKKETVTEQDMQKFDMLQGESMDMLEQTMQLMEDEEDV